jgi:hypothetical protein
LVDEVTNVGNAEVAVDALVCTAAALVAEFAEFAIIPVSWDPLPE